MIKVLEFIPGYNFGGIESVFQYSAQNTNSEEIQINLLVEDIANKNKIEELRENGINVSIIPRLKYRSLNKYILEINKVLSQANYDIIHSYNITRSPILFIIAKYNKIKHRIFHARTNKTDGNFFKKIFFRLNIIIGTYFASTLLANSKEAGKFFFIKKNFTIINNGLDFRKFKFDGLKRKEIRSVLDLSDEIVIGHIGRFTIAKNHAFLVDVFSEYLKENPKSKLLLVGDGPLLGEVKLKVEKLGISGKVIFTGSVSNPQDFYQAMDFFLFPSVYEGFGNVLLEAQASGIQVLASDSVPSTTKVSNLIEYFPLEKKPSEWKEKININHNKDRKEYYKILLTSGYDISEVLKLKKKLYLNLLESESNK